MKDAVVDTIRLKETKDGTIQVVYLSNNREVDVGDANFFLNDKILTNIVLQAYFTGKVSEAKKVLPDLLQ